MKYINCLHLVNDCGLEVHEDCPGHVLACPCLGEEGVKAVVPASDGLIRGHLAIWLDTWIHGLFEVT